MVLFSGKWLTVACAVAVVALAGCGGGSSSSSSSSDSSTSSSSGSTLTCINTGNGTDTFTVAGVSYTEGKVDASTATGVAGLCDPLIQGFVRNATSVEAKLGRGYTTPGAWTEEVQVYGDPTQGSVAQTIDGSEIEVHYFTGLTNNGSTAVADCESDTGTISFSAIGVDLTGLITGGFTVTHWISNVGSCPTTPFSGTFSVTRKDDKSY